MKLSEIKAVFDKNAIVLEQCAMYLNHTPDAMTRAQMEEITGGDKSLEERSFALFLANVFFEDEEQMTEFYREYYLNGVKKLNPCDYVSDPYYKNIKIPEAQIGKWTLKNQEYKPYEAFVYNDLKVQGYKEIPQLGFFDDTFSFPTVFENGVEWMAIKPNEIETMKEPISRAKGNVLVLGLGLGYYAYMISLKNEVSEITIVERDEGVIRLFESHILPQFENANKIKIVKADALEYLKKNASKKKIDFVFADLWRDASDGVELYVKLKKLEVLNPKTEYSYWIERTLISSIKASVFNSLYPKLSSGELIKSEQEIEEMLSDSYIKELARYL